MRTLTFIFLLICATAQSQELITNGINWHNSNGLADGWHKGPLVSATHVVNGKQHVESYNSNWCSQAFIGQYLNIKGKRTFHLEFEVTSNQTVYVTAWGYLLYGYNLMILKPGSHVISFTWYEGSQNLVRLSWHTSGISQGFIVLDNVTLTEGDGSSIIPTKSEPVTISNALPDNRIFDLLGRRLSKVPEHGIYIKNHKTYVK